MAACFAKYVRITSAPALLKHSKASWTAFFSSIHPYKRNQDQDTVSKIYWKLSSASQLHVANSTKHQNTISAPYVLHKTLLTFFDAALIIEYSPETW